MESASDWNSSKMNFASACPCLRYATVRRAADNWSVWAPGWVKSRKSWALRAKTTTTRVKTSVKRWKYTLMSWMTKINCSKKNCQKRNGNIIHEMWCTCNKMQRQMVGHGWIPQRVGVRCMVWDVKTADGQQNWPLVLKSEKNKTTKQNVIGVLQNHWTVLSWVSEAWLAKPFWTSPWLTQGWDARKNAKKNMKTDW